MQRDPDCCHKRHQYCLRREDCVENVLLLRGCPAIVNVAKRKLALRIGLLVGWSSAASWKVGMDPGQLNLSPIARMILK